MHGKCLQVRYTDENSDSSPISLVQFNAKYVRENVPATVNVAGGKILRYKIWQCHQQHLFEVVSFEVYARHHLPFYESLLNSVRLNLTIRLWNEIRDWRQLFPSPRIPAITKKFHQKD